MTPAYLLESEAGNGPLHLTYYPLSHPTHHLSIIILEEASSKVPMFDEFDLTSQYRVLSDYTRMYIDSLFNFFWLGIILKNGFSTREPSVKEQLKPSYICDRF